ncbi:MAG: FAD synthase [DPANN group archaeon]|nr:FAD synthase [DPANN group archaeon]
MKKIMVFGSFDHLHPGHINFFRQAKEHGTYLLVAVARDATIKQIKGRLPVFTEDERMQHLMAIPDVDEVVLGYPDDKFKVIEENRPDIICLGHDQHVFADRLPEELRRRGLDIPVVRLKAYRRDIYQSSHFRKNSWDLNSPEDLNRKHDALKRTIK